MVCVIIAVSLIFSWAMALSLCRGSADADADDYAEKLFKEKMEDNKTDSE